MKKWIVKKKNNSGKENCSICNNEEILIQHHIRGRKIPNADKQYNLASICDRCHKKVHMGLIILEDWAMTSDGMKLLWHLPGEAGLTGNDAKVHIF